jgi:hypothetical protein
VELKSDDGFVSLQGEILEFSDDMLRVRTGHGEISIPANEVSCIGAACPEGLRRGDVEDELSVAFSDNGRRDLFLAFLSARDVAARSDTTIEVVDGLTARVRSGSAYHSASMELLSPGQASEQMLIATESVGISPTVAFDGPLDWASPGGVEKYHLALKGLDVLVGPGTGVDALSVEDLARIYAGEATNWREFGGNDLRIQALRSVEGTESHENLKAAVMTPYGRDQFGPSLAFQDEDKAAKIARVAQGAIAVVSHSEEASGAKQIAIKDECGTVVPASEFSINAGLYPLTVSAFATVSADVDSQLMSRVFAAAATTPALADAGYADETILIGDMADKSDRIAALSRLDAETRAAASVTDLLETILNADQLSMSFRDGPVGAAMGAKNRADFLRLAEAIQSGLYDGKEIHFVGFANGANDTEAVSQSQAAATSIARAFAAFAPAAVSYDAVQFRTSGHGKAGKPFCAVQTATGARNEVEVWVRDAS